jgi:hypothetical protein
MEVIYSVFQIILVFLTDNIYDLSLVNNLFSFDLGNETIEIKNIKNIINENIMLENKSVDFKSKILLKDISSNRMLNIHNLQNLNNNIIKDDNLNKDSKNNNLNLLSRSVKIKKIKKYKKKLKSNTSLRELQTTGNSEIKNINLINLSAKDSKPDKNNDIQNITNLNESNLKDKENKREKETEKEKENGEKKEIALNNESQTKIDELKYNIFLTYFCLLCFRKKKNVKNNLLNR